MAGNLRKKIFCLVLLAAPFGLSLDATARLVIDADDAQSRDDLEAMLSRCEEESPAFHDIMEAVRRSDRDVEMDPVRGADADGTFIDGFNSGEVDLDDLDDLPQPTPDGAGGWDFPPGVSPQSITRCQALIHVVWERFFSNYVGGRYGPSHESANDIEERIRRDYGQDGGAVDHTGQNDGVTTVYRNGSTFLEVIPTGGGDDVSGPPVTTPVAVICLATCGAGDHRFQFGDATCAACRTQATNFCATRGSALGDFACRSGR